MDQRDRDLVRDLTKLQEFALNVTVFRNQVQLCLLMRIPPVGLEDRARVLTYLAIDIHDLIFVQRGAQFRRLARVNRVVGDSLRRAMQAQEEFRQIMLEHFVPLAGLE